MKFVKNLENFQTGNARNEVIVQNLALSLERGLSEPRARVNMLLSLERGMERASSENATFKNSTKILNSLKYGITL